MTREIVHVGRKIKVALDTEELDNGQTIRRDIVIHPGAVAILPMVDKDHICLLRNQRPIVEETLWEIPAGTLEPNEPTIDAAKRELAEETGYTAAKWKQLNDLIPSPGVLSERIYLYLAEDLTPGEMNLEPCEQLEPQIVAWREALEWARNGTILDAKTIIALFLVFG